MNIIIQKFGGTSVATHENRNKIISRIIEQHQKGYKLVVVVSAIGRMGDPYSTDSLVSLVDTETIQKRELDLLMSCGEIISAVVLSDLLNKKGYKTIVFTGFQSGITTDNNFGHAEILTINSMKITDSLNDGKIVILTGFQGVTEDGDITTLGRGGSDTTAVAIGEALNCQYVEIYTDVDGIMTADPRIVPEAKLIEAICYSEVYQMAEDGAKVIHPKAVEIAERGNIEIKIKNSFKKCIGTTITSKNIIKKNKIYDQNNLITAFTYKKNRAQVIISITEKSLWNNNLLDEITKNEISIDLINFFLDKRIFTIDNRDIKRLEMILDKNNCKYHIINNCCKLSIIGHRIRGIPGIMAKIVHTLSEGKIDILQTSDSHTTIWCLIKEKDTEEAIKALHKAFN